MGGRPVTALVQRGLPPALRAGAAQLYWQAFGGKLGRVLGPRAKALAFLERAIREDQVIVALDLSGNLLGIAGFKTPEGSFAGGGVADMRAIYGRIGAAWRGGLLRLLAQEIDNTRFLLDGICVTPAARGQGLGAALLQAICDEAGSRGYRAVRLDVVDGNWRARALYARLGFVAEKTEKLGLLRFVFGFASSTTMVRALD